jgi:hypothetical protein
MFLRFDHINYLVLAKLAWLLVTSILFTQQLASHRHFGVFAIDARYQLTLLILISVILTLWR